MRASAGGVRMRRRIRGRAGVVRFVLGAAVVLCGGSFAEGASAEVRRVEAVGIYGIQDSARRRVIPRDEAIERGTWEAVSRVALELIGESAPPGGDGAEEGQDTVRRPIDGRGRSEEGAGSGGLDDEAAARLRSALGDDMLPYTRSYRILEDRGEGPVLFA